MPILAVDQFGQIYETSPDRADGLGYGRHAATAEQGDVTLGAAYLKHGRDYRNDVLRDAQIQHEVDRQDRIARTEERRRLMELRRNQMAEETLLDNEMYQRNLLRKAIQMGCNCEMKTEMSGNVLTANGQSGWNGMSRDQQAIHHHMSGMGQNVSHQIDPIEAHQRQLEQQAAQLLYNQAQADAKRVKAEAAQARLERDIRSGRVKSRTAVTTPFLSRRLFNWNPFKR